MVIGEGEVSEPRFGASMYDAYVQGGFKEGADTSFVWNNCRQTMALFPKDGERFLRISTDILVTLHLLRNAKFSPWKTGGA